MAPEVLAGDLYDPKIDLWSCGTIMYQMATGTTPYRASSVRDLQEKMRNAQSQPLAIPPHVSEEFRDLLLALLRPNPKSRLTFEQFYSHRWFHLQFNTVNVVPVAFEEVSVDAPHKANETSQTVLDPENTSFVIVDKLATDTAQKLERMLLVPPGSADADAVTQTGLQELVTTVVGQTALVIQVADRQTLWERLLLYGRAMLILRSSSSRAHDFMDSLAHRRLLPATIASVRKYHNCMQHCLTQVETMRRRVHELTEVGAKRTPRKAVQPKFCLKVHYSRAEGRSGMRTGNIAWSRLFCTKRHCKYSSV